MRILSKLQLGAMPISLLQLPFFRDESRHEQRIHSHSDKDVSVSTAQNENSKTNFDSAKLLSMVPFYLHINRTLVVVVAPGPEQEVEPVHSCIELFASLFALRPYEYDVYL